MGCGSPKGNAPQRASERSAPPAAQAEQSTPDATAAGSEPLPPSAQTPGFFRNLRRLLNAQRGLAPQVAWERWLVELPNRLASFGALPPMPSEGRATLRSLLHMALRTLQAAASQPEWATPTGARLVSAALGLDPALWASSAPEQPTPTTLPGRKTVARAALTGVKQLARAASQSGCREPVNNAATWQPTATEEVWVPEHCAAADVVSGYCAQGHWVEEQCHDEWVCEQGEVEYEGSYVWVCHGDDCEYEWRQEPVWAEDCSDGYWQEVCDGGYWEPGVCYDSVTMPGECSGGHYVQQADSGSWMLQSSIATPTGCTPLRTVQIALARSGLLALRDQFPDAWGPATQAAAAAFWEHLEATPHWDEATFAAAIWLLRRAAGMLPQ